jgi:AhpD family alkylhydroperoxidase
MATTLVQFALRRSVDQVRHVAPVRPRHARDLVAEVYRQVETDFGMLAPPVILHSPAPLPLAACWMILRETLVAPGFADRATKEVVAAAVSGGNACPYCVEVHGATLHSLAPTRADDPAMAAVANWARTSASRAGATPCAAPFPVEQTAEVIGVAVTFHYLNRMVNVFLGESPLPPRVPAGARERTRRFLGRLMRSAARRARTPGRSLDLLPAAPLPPDLSWAAGNPTVADAFARAAAVFDEAGKRCVPPAVRALVTAQLSEWDGEHPGLSRAWVTGPTAGLCADQLVAARLALLVAKASYQADESVISEFRRHYPDDRDLIELTCWASWEAARQVGRRMAAGIRAHCSGEDRRAS